MESVRGVSGEKKVNGVSHDQRVGEPPEKTVTEQEAAKKSEESEEANKKFEEVKGVKEVDVKA
jgi:hypothetical protein